MPKSTSEIPMQPLWYAYTNVCDLPQNESTALNQGENNYDRFDDTDPHHYNEIKNPKLVNRIICAAGTAVGILLLGGIGLWVFFSLRSQDRDIFSRTVSLNDTTTNHLQNNTSNNSNQITINGSDSPLNIPLSKLEYIETKIKDQLIDIHEHMDSIITEEQKTYINSSLQNSVEDINSYMDNTEINKQTEDAANNLPAFFLSLYSHTTDDLNSNLEQAKQNITLSQTQTLDTYENIYLDSVNKANMTLQLINSSQNHQDAISKYKDEINNLYKNTIFSNLKPLKTTIKKFKAMQDDAYTMMKIFGEQILAGNYHSYHSNRFVIYYNFYNLLDMHIKKLKTEYKLMYISANNNAMQQLLPVIDMYDFENKETILKTIKKNSISKGAIEQITNKLKSFGNEMKMYSRDISLYGEYNLYVSRCAIRVPHFLQDGVTLNFSKLSNEELKKHIQSVLSRYPTDLCPHYPKQETTLIDLTALEEGNRKLDTAKDLFFDIMSHDIHRKIP